MSTYKFYNNRRNTCTNTSIIIPIFVILFLYLQVIIHLFEHCYSIIILICVRS